MIIVYGDVHGDFRTFRSFCDKLNPEIVLQVGDFGYYPNYLVINKSIRQNLIDVPYKVYFCDGNHEHHKELKLLNDGHISNNVQYMSRGKTISLPDGRTVMFLGGALSVDKEVRKLDVDYFTEETISYKEFMNFDLSKKVDIVISHTCPTRWIKKGINVFEKDPTTEALEQILDILKPDSWYFGHWHFSYEGVDPITGTKYKCMNMQPSQPNKEIDKVADYWWRID